MNENEQVEEMARCLEMHTCMSGFQAEIGAKVLHSKGYRKVDRGEWEQYGLRNPKCTLCHGYNTEKSNFCPHCGADMRGEKDGSTRSN